LLELALDLLELALDLLELALELIVLALELIVLVMMQRELAASPQANQHQGTQDQGLGVEQAR